MLCNIITKNRKIFSILPKLTGCNMANKSNAIAWFNNEKEAFSTAKEQRKALMMLFHREWCGACKKLWPKINNDPEIQELSAKFVMIDMRNENEKMDVKYTPDGEYVPRVIFADPDGNMLKNVQNESNLTGINQFSYKEPPEIISSMKKALASISNI